MNEHQAAELERILSGRPTYKRVTVTPQETGAHIIIEHRAAGRGVFTIRDGPSALLNYLLPGHAGLTRGNRNREEPH